MAPNTPYVTVVVGINAGSIRRQYELPREPDDIDRQAFVRWLLDLIPDVNERHQRGPVEIYREEWP